MRFPGDVPTLNAGEVTLRAHRIEDAAAIVEQCTDPVSVEWTTVPLGYTHEMGVDWVRSTIPEAWEKETEYLFAIEATHPSGERRFSGTVSLRDHGERRAELAFGAHPAVRGRGVMTTAVGLLLDWGFAERGFETVIWLANKGNLASRRVAWKSGFTFGGTVRRWLDHRGEYTDAWVAALHRHDSRDPKSTWYELPRIVGERVTLRSFRDDDVPRVVEACSDPVSRHWLAALPAPYTEQDARDFIAFTHTLAAEGGAVLWAVADSDDDEIVGQAGLPRIGPAGGEVGYWMHPAARGRGLMQAAVRMVVRHAFVPVEDGGLGLRRVHLKAAAGNVASQHVARGAGFREIGRERAAERVGDGTYADLLLFDLLPSDAPFSS